MELELISTELLPFKLSHFGSFFLTIRYTVFKGFFSYFVNMLGNIMKIYIIWIKLILTVTAI